MSETLINAVKDKYGSVATNGLSSQGHRIKPAILGRLVKCSFIHWRRT